MAIHQTHKQSDLEKRLKLLRTQMYGKNQDTGYRIQDTVNTNSNTTTFSDSIYLKKDLTKIAFLSTLAFGVQIILFYLIKNNLLSIKLF